MEACPPSAWYRFRKFARRKKARAGGGVGNCPAVARGGWHVGRQQRSRVRGAGTRATQLLRSAHCPGEPRVVREQPESDGSAARRSARPICATGNGITSSGCATARFAASPRKPRSQRGVQPRWQAPGQRHSVGRQSESGMRKLGRNSKNGRLMKMLLKALRLAQTAGIWPQEAGMGR